MRQMTGTFYEPTVAQATEEQKNKARKGKKIFLGNGRRDGWRGELPFYLFWCKRCEKFSVDYKHWFNPFVTCQSCGTQFSF